MPVVSNRRPPGSELGARIVAVRCAASSTAHARHIVGIAILQAVVAIDGLRPDLSYHLILAPMVWGEAFGYNNQKQRIGRLRSPRAHNRTRQWRPTCTQSARHFLNHVRRANAPQDFLVNVVQLQGRYCSIISACCCGGCTRSSLQHASRHQRTPIQLFEVAKTAAWKI